MTHKEREERLCITCGRIVETQTLAICNCCWEAINKNLHSCNDLPLSTKVQLLRSAKRLIEALNLPEGGGIYFDGFWHWTVSRPVFSDKLGIWQHMAPTSSGNLPWGVLTIWVGNRGDSWITRDTPETELGE